MAAALSLGISPWTSWRESRGKAVGLGENCGTGKGGFQPGNTCAAEDGTSSGAEGAPTVDNKPPADKPQGRIAQLVNDAKGIEFTNAKVSSDPDPSSRTTVKDKWGKSHDASRDQYNFSVKSADGTPLNYQINVDDFHGTKSINFTDASGSFDVTGAAGPRAAAEVFRKVTSAVIGYVNRKAPESLGFSAAEPSRQKLYDRIVKTAAAASPEYVALSKVADLAPGLEKANRKRPVQRTKYYSLVRRDQYQFMKSALSDDGYQIMVEGVEFRESWLDESGWADGNSDQSPAVSDGPEGIMAQVVSESDGPDCGTGAGGFKPGNTCAAGEESGEKKISERGSKLLKDAEAIEFTDENIAGDIDVDELSLDEIENELSYSESRAMSEYMDEAMQSAYDDYDSSYNYEEDIDEEDVANDAGWGNRDIADSGRSFAGDDEQLVEAIDEWYNGSSDYGVDGIESMVSSVENQYASLVGTEAHDTMTKWADKMRSEIDSADSAISDARDSKIEEIRDSNREDFYSNYESGDDREHWLREFASDNSERFSAGGEGKLNVWGKSRGGYDGYKFNVENPKGSDDFRYEIAVSQGDNATLSFDEKEGGYSITGEAGPKVAAQVFKTVATATVAWVRKNEPESVFFSAAEPSRQKLYDRLVKTTAEVLPNYMAFAQGPAERGTTTGGKGYLLVRRDVKGKAEARFGSQGKYTTLVESQENYESWFLPEAWADPSPTDGGSDKKSIWAAAIASGKNRESLVENCGTGADGWNSRAYGTSDRRRTWKAAIHGSRLVVREAAGTGSNCGTGKGGFQAGNKCASGRDGGSAPNANDAPAGSRDQNVDSASSQTVSVEQARDDLLRRKDKREHSILTDEHGRIIGRMSGEDGAEEVNVVNTPRRMDPNERLIQHHNHPIDTPPSLGDMLFLSGNPGVKEVYAHSDNAMYHVRVLDGVDRDQMHHAVRDAYHKASVAEVEKNLTTSSDQVTPESRRKFYTNIAETALKELSDNGFIQYRREQGKAPASTTSIASKMEVPKIAFAETDNGDQFVAARNKSTRPENFSELDPERLKSSKKLLSADGKTGCLVDSTGDLGNVFNNGGPKGAGMAAVVAGIQAGAKTLDCYDGFLPDRYAQLGFKATAKIRWNDDYAPPGWDYNKLGRPDVVIMSYQGGPRDTIQDRIGSFEPYKPLPDERYTDDFDAAKADARVQSDPA